MQGAWGSPVYVLEEGKLAKRTIKYFRNADYISWTLHSTMYPDCYDLSRPTSPLPEYGINLGRPPPYEERMQYDEAGKIIFIIGFGECKIGFMVGERHTDLCLVLPIAWIAGVALPFLRTLPTNDSDNREIGRRLATQRDVRKQDEVWAIRSALAMVMFVVSTACLMQVTTGLSQNSGRMSS